MLENVCWWRSLCCDVQRSYPPFSENHDLVNVVVIDLIIKCELHNSIVKDDEVKEIWQGAKDVFFSSVWRALPDGISIDSWCEFKLLILCLKWQLVLYNITTQDYQNSQLSFLRKLSMILINWKIHDSDLAFMNHSLLDILKTFIRSNSKLAHYHW